MTIANSGVTPMMAQYLEIKSAHEDALLFYRMGDFYEMFFDDAVAAAAALDIALTKRGKHLGQDIPMCGVPVHSAENYLQALIRKGFRVAVAEQTEDPAEAKKRGSKAVVNRAVVRLVTPGTLTEDTLLDARRHNYLAAFAVVRDAAALGWVDISTGEIRVMPCPRVQLGPELARLAPSEVLVAQEREAELAEVVEDAGASITSLSGASFDSASAQRRICAAYGVESLQPFGNFERAEIAALGGLLAYLDLTQKGQMPRLQPPVQEVVSKNVQIDAATRRNLELTHSLSGGRDGSLLSAIDRTLTAQGARLLARQISAPSRILGEIRERLGAVAFFVEQPDLAGQLRDCLRKTPDLDRALSRLSLNRGGPRDMAAIRNGLEQAQNIARLFASMSLPARISNLVEGLAGDTDLLQLLDNALVAEPPLLARDGGFIAAGYDSALDDLRKLRDEGRGVIAAMQAEYSGQTGIGALKVKHNNVLGYFIETPATHAEKMLSAPLSEQFIHRQTTANAVRFTTVALSEMETRILNAGGQAIEREISHYSALTNAILDAAAQISLAADALAALDVTASHADVALQHQWCRPEVDDSRAFQINLGRHPVVERALRQQGGAPFVANDCDLTATDGKAAAWLLTGPNMAGKSTFLRQNALIALLAQAGAFVPAHSARIGLVSQIFSRVGASDDLARGRSTFMVEMVETAAILNQADDHALVILDEIGRGTATYDGLSIAWATLEHLHDINRCRTLFATHYHELTTLAEKLSGLQNATVAVKEWEGEVIFLHEVKKGAADRSYGVQVAKLAGLPDVVVGRARVILDALEKGERERSGQKALIDDLPLFAATPVAAPAPPGQSTALEEKLAEIHPDQLTPIDALNVLYQLKDLMND